MKKILVTTILVLFYISNLFSQNIINENNYIKNKNGNLYVTIDTIYNMSDSESKISAKEIALKMAKLESSSVAGSFIQNNLQIKNGKITLNEIKVVTATVMSIKINTEKLLVKNGTLKLHLNTTAIINSKSLDKNLKAFRKSESKKKQLLTLAKKNKKLLNDIKSLSNKLSSKKLTDYASITKKRKQLLDKMNANSKSMQNVFKKGSLFSMANKFEQELEFHREIALLDYKQNMLENTKIITKILKVMPNIDDKKLVDVLVEVNIIFSPSALNTLTKYYEYRNTRKQNGWNSRFEWVNDVINSEKGWKTQYSENLSKTFLGDDFRVKICLGKYNCTNKIIIKSRGANYGSSYSANIFNIVNKTIKFKRISKSKLQYIDRIDSKVFWSKRKKNDFQDDWESR